MGIFSIDEHYMCIYRLISPNGKSYVGQSRNYNDRQKRRLREYNKWIEHLQSNEYLKNPKLFYAFLKYGVDNFVCEILEENIKTIEELNDKEIYYIDCFRCVEKGYNVLKGGIEDVLINPNTGRSFRYGHSKYFSNRTDNRKAYDKERYEFNRDNVLNRVKKYNNANKEMMKKNHLKHRNQCNKRRCEQRKFLLDSDLLMFGKSNSIGILFRKIFAGGRTRPHNYIAPKNGYITEDYCCLYIDI